MQLVFHASDFSFPYTHLKFPGQASDERILYVARESLVVFWVRLFWVMVISLGILFSGLLFPFLVSNMPWAVSLMVVLVAMSSASLLGLVASWWVYQLWRKSVFVITNRRLTKFIYTTPWNRYNLSLGLDKVVDTGAYAKTYFESVFNIGTFTARSGAGNRKDKYFYVENVSRHEDLANYVNKVLFVFNKDSERLHNFRPFIPHLKGEARKNYMKQYPDYWS